MTTEWTFDDCRVIRDGDVLKVIIEGPYDYRMMEIASSDIERDVTALDSGSSPVGDGWEDGTGRTVCYDNGVLCDEDGKHQALPLLEEVPALEFLRWGK